ncbi:oxygen-independent coproporphyrinogen III oxidase [Paracoccus gahaiensis]|uniref:Coproporphyrinogen-III oxidase n=1 Tax=Paracoccus gahaiensis TaxID=1706839 RepID=A0A4U0RDJ5_9RHOB|nr:oxygen-independent coproporphyrinogen III oxidase [Paracoccus gahaiensis]TJZ93453.1 oxygen-independent coproporphyrinogen III oxidase [Paracoccus gahaiensis]
MEQISQLRRAGLFEARAPRYTSYPPATQFGPGVDGDLVGDWMGAILPGTAVSLYVHVPFCKRLCWFCACRTQGTQSLAPVAAYVETLLVELRQMRRRLPQGVVLSRLHWGGGTPSLLTPALVRKLAGAIFEAFPMAPGGEFSVEIDPTEIDAPRMAALAEAGMTRASIGVQDFDPLIQEAIGRPQSFALTAEAVRLIRDHGIAGLNADILYGLPHQTGARMAETVQQLLALAPDRVALYGYAHVPWMSKRQVMIPEAALPDGEARLALFDTARALFLQDGFRQIGIDHFSRPHDRLALAAGQGQLRRNFQGYTDDAAQVLLGLGASSISRYPQGYAQNAPATGVYVGAVRSGRAPVTRGHAFRAEDAWRGRMIEALMCDFRIDLDEIRDRFCLSIDQQGLIYAPLLRRFAPVVVLEGGTLRITPEGQPMTRLVAQALDSYAAAEGSHSSAV